MQVEPLEDRPERQQSVDAALAYGNDPAVRVADAFPIGNRSAGEGCGEHRRPGVVAGITVQRLHGRVRPGRHHQRRGQRHQLQPHAMAKVKPLRFRRKIDPDHGQPARLLTSATVHIRAGLVANAACQSNDACTPFGPL